MTFAETIGDRTLSLKEKQVRINRQLYAQGEDGVQSAVNAVIEATSGVPAFYAANFLAGCPGHRDEKNAALRELMIQRPDWSAAVARLVEFADDANFERLERYAVDSEPGPRTLSTVHALARHFPDRMRPHRQVIAPYGVSDLLLPGAPDDYVEELFTRYQRTENASAAIQLSYVRTDAARDALLSLSRRAQSGKSDFFFALAESAGQFADTGEASTYSGSFQGFIADEGRSPHEIGGAPAAGSVPISVAGQQTAERILELQRADLPFWTAGNFDPTFFWYEGRSRPRSVCVKQTENARIGFRTAMGRAKNTRQLVGARGSVVLEEERHEYGIGGAPVTGTGRIQIGGYPQWRTLERFPRCPECGRGMRFIASVDSGLTPFTQLTFKGTLYAFWCEQCDVTCTRGQL